jgi:uncharacterized protein YjiS (DUF1127 family)
MLDQHRTIADCHDARMKGGRLKALREAAPRVQPRPAAAALPEVGEPGSHPAFWVAPGAAIGHIAAALLLWWDRARLRRQLLPLSDYALKDIGRNRADVVGGGDQPFWRARIDPPRGF